ncbi:hypothetical protein WICMUC_000005 [Wickerhamomyces mucosus]|uniref:Uncharacterized protein n=1 Tax=Wickerhamomyces mucosus TaxID=1378264 RepID=A0A9P8Q1B8_9ASCO|nr:hypothetical protein WICMUC_000005 [Wickerhamomyces mucosus]
MISSSSSSSRSMALPPPPPLLLRLPDSKSCKILFTIASSAKADSLANLFANSERFCLILVISSYIFSSSEFSTSLLSPSIPPKPCHSSSDSSASASIILSNPLDFISFFLRLWSNSS